MTEPGIQIVEKDGVHHLAGVLNEYADFSVLENQPAPLCLDLGKVSRLNSIGIRNLLKLLNKLGDKTFVYQSVPVEFIDQVNMIPTLLGTKGQGRIASLFVPYACTVCSAEEEVLAPLDQFAAVAAGSDAPKRKCGKCGGVSKVLTESFFAFLHR